MGHDPNQQQVDHGRSLIYRGASSRSTPGLLLTSRLRPPRRPVGPPGGLRGARRSGHPSEAFGQRVEKDLGRERTVLCSKRRELDGAPEISVFCFLMCFSMFFLIMSFFVWRVYDAKERCRFLLGSSATQFGGYVHSQRF